MHRHQHRFYGPTAEMTRWMNLINEVRNTEEQPEQRWRPRVDILEDEHEYRIHADLPGVNKDSIDITIEEGVLTLSGERPAVERKEGETIYRAERLHGQFKRRFNVRDSIKSNDIHASFDNGVLTIRLPKADEAKPRKIEIEGMQN